MPAEPLGAVRRRAGRLARRVGVRRDTHAPVGSISAQGRSVLLDSLLFDQAWVETQLAPTLQPGDVVILDNLSSHKSERAKAILKERGAWFLFLPPYSPDLNPIEMAFAKLKAHLRRIGARTIDALWRAVGSICDLYSSDECWNYFKAAGYAPD